MKSLRRLLFLLPLVVLLSLTTAPGQTIVPGENLVVEGIPPLPAALAEEVGRYGDFRQATLQGWHPTRREMLITTRFAETNQLHWVKFPGGARTQLTFFSDRVAGGSVEPVKGDTFLFSKDIGGGEYYQLYLYDLRDGKIRMLTDGKSRNTDPEWSRQGDRIAFGSTRRNGEDVDIWVMSPSDPVQERMLLQLQGGGWGPRDWSPDGRRLLVGNEVSASESYLYLADVSSGEKVLLTPEKGADTVLYAGGRFSADGKGIYVISDRDSEYQHLAYLDLATKKETPLTAGIPWDIDEFALSDDGRMLAFAVNEDGLGVLHLLDTKTGKERPAPKLPAGLVGGLEWHRNNRDLGFVFSSSAEPYDAYSADVTTGKVERWTKSETGGLNTASFSRPELIRWKSWDGKSISGFLFKPPARFTGKRPVVIDIHGGPEGQYRPDFNGRDNFFIEELGAAMIYPNVRGSLGYGKSFQKMDNGFLREGSYKDIAALLDWIGTRPDLDSDRIMVTGGSYGGFMTLAVATSTNDRIRCALSVVGPSNLVTFLENTSPYRRDLRRVEYGDERDPKMRAFLEEIAPAARAKNITKPLFVVQGKNDPRVPASESEQMVATVRKNGTPVWYLMARDEGHGFAKKKNRDFQFYATVAFMKEFLLK
jgi:dipeptidyl aminopeptidase/acylaminoacyl peptidase